MSTAIDPEKWDRQVSAFQLEVDEFVAARFDMDPKVRAMKLAEEAGEVVGAVVRLLEGRGDRQAVSDEAGDLAITLAALLASLDIAMSDAVLNRWAAISERTWPHLEPR